MMSLIPKIPFRSSSKVFVMNSFKTLSTLERVIVNPISSHSNNLVHVFIGNLPLEYSVDDIKSFLKTSKVNNHIGAPRLALTPKGKFRGFAFLDFESHDTAASAVKALTGIEAGGRLIKVDITNTKDADHKGRRDSRLSEEFQVFIGNLPFKVSAAELQELIQAEIGSESPIKIKLHTDGRKPLGYCHVIFSNEKDMNTVMEKLHNAEVQGRVINVERAIPIVKNTTTSENNADQTALLGSQQHQHFESADEEYTEEILQRTKARKNVAKRVMKNVNDSHNVADDERNNRSFKPDWQQQDNDSRGDDYVNNVRDKPARGTNYGKTGGSGLYRHSEGDDRYDPSERNNNRNDANREHSHRDRSEHNPRGRSEHSPRGRSEYNPRERNNFHSDRDSNSRTNNSRNYGGRCSGGRGGDGRSRGGRGGGGRGGDGRSSGGRGSGGRGGDGRSSGGERYGGGGGRSR